MSTRSVHIANHTNNYLENEKSFFVRVHVTTYASKVRVNEMHSIISYTNMRIIIMCVNGFKVIF